MQRRGKLYTAENRSRGGSGSGSSSSSNVGPTAGSDDTRGRTTTTTACGTRGDDLEHPQGPRSGRRDGRDDEYTNPGREAAGEGVAECKQRGAGDGRGAGKRLRGTDPPRHECNGRCGGSSRGSGQGEVADEAAREEEREEGEGEDIDLHHGWHRPQIQLLMVSKEGTTQSAIPKVDRSAQSTPSMPRTARPTPSTPSNTQVQKEERVRRTNHPPQRYHHHLPLPTD